MEQHSQELTNGGANGEGEEKRVIKAPRHWIRLAVKCIIGDRFAAIVRHSLEDLILDVHVFRRRVFDKNL